MYSIKLIELIPEKVENDYPTPPEHDLLINKNGNRKKRSEK